MREIQHNSLSFGEFVRREKQRDLGAEVYKQIYFYYELKLKLKISPARRVLVKTQ